MDTWVWIVIAVVVIAAIALVAAAVSASGCTVRPLYADAGLETGSLAGNPAGLSHSVTVKPVTGNAKPAAKPAADTKTKADTKSKAQGQKADAAAKPKSVAN